MNIDHLQLFVRIASTEHISSAGKELGLSPAVASAHMSKLEQDLGVRLVHRTTRQVSLTEDGRAFLPHAINVIESVDIARASIGSGSISPKGKLRVTASASFGRMHLLPVLDAFLKRYPQLQIDLHLSDTLVGIVEGGFDIAIRDAALNDSSLIARRIAPVSRIVCASPDYLEQYGRPQTPSDLKQHKCINMIGLDTWTFEAANGQQNVKTHSVLQVDNGEAARDACILGGGITISSTWCCYQQLQHGQLVPILTDYTLLPTTDLWAVYPSSRMLAPKVRVLIDYFLEQFGDQPYWENINTDTPRFA